ncbi:MAG: ABC transporter ATP-binding protein [Aquamicrobium sp.]|uniref:ABC transporter ATP-binding protein n=1 Tax=Aquamicrobium sp. TaxID=1872579 RepID=UPI00349EEE98|nr:ABC transporter ATP-binding protein [Aquamicrobium sp.]MCO5155881.1 ABC transporter ATP-binding protein [Aquamicrobium sp.]
MLEIKGLTKRFGGLFAVNNLNQFVEEKEFLGIIGPNGAGKTTLLNLITGYLTPTEGTISFKGREISGTPPYRMCRMGIGRTFQVVRPFAEMTVLDNVATGALFARPERHSVAEGRRLAQRPLELTGLWELRDLPASALTIGNKKKLELARALATGPQLLLLDEVMAGLTRGEIDELIVVLKHIHADGVTICMIEHLVHVIMQLSQRVMVLNFGEKIVDGSPQEVISNPLVIESYLGKEIEEGSDAA